VGAVFIDGLVYDLALAAPATPTVLDVLNDWQRAQPRLVALAGDQGR
jgi:hypothetical protein